MGLILSNTAITEEAENFFNVEVNLDQADFMPGCYTFPDTKTDSEMEADIIADLTAKGFTGLAPAVWE